MINVNVGLGIFILERDKGSYTEKLYALLYWIDKFILIKWGFNENHNLFITSVNEFIY